MTPSPTPASTPTSSRTRILFSVLVGLVGLAWIGQGLGFIGGGFMSGNAVWAFIGVGVVAVAVIVAAWPRLRRR